MAIMEMTTSSSMRVNPAPKGERQELDGVKIIAAVLNDFCDEPMSILKLIGNIDKRTRIQ